MRSHLPGGEVVRGREHVIAHYQQEWEGFPDAHVDTKLLVADGSVVVAEWIWTATNTGPLSFPDGRAIAATGRRISLPGVDVREMKDGLIAAVRVYWDNMSLTRQLGLLPTRAA